MQFKFTTLATTLAATLALVVPAAAVNIDFYVGNGCRGGGIVKSSTVHETNHLYNCGSGANSMWISDNGLNRAIVITSGGSGSFRGSGCFTYNSCSTYELRV